MPDDVISEIKDYYSPVMQARRGSYYRAGFTVAGTALLGAQFALWNPGARSGYLWVSQVKVSASVATPVQLFSINVNPGLAAVNPPFNCNFALDACSAVFTGAAAAVPNTVGELGDIQLPAGGTECFIDSGGLIIPPNWGIAVSFPVGVVLCSLSLAWAETLGTV